MPNTAAGISRGPPITSRSKARTSRAALRVVLEWPTKEAALNFENDPDYKPYLESRLNRSTSYHFVIDGKDDLA